jgi:hypothetical protein
VCSIVAAGQLLPEANFVPPPAAPGEEDQNGGTQFPLELTARPPGGGPPPPRAKVLQTATVTMTYN